MNEVINQPWTPERVRAIRVVRAIAVEDAAKLVGVLPRTWQSWEQPSQRRQPTPSQQILLELLERRVI